MVPQIYLRRLYLSIVIIIGGGIAAMAFDRGDRPVHLTMTSVAAAIAFDRGDRPEHLAMTVVAHTCISRHAASTSTSRHSPSAFTLNTHTHTHTVVIIIDYIVGSGL